MDKLEFGTYQAITNCIRLKTGEKLCIITDLATQEIASALKRHAEAISPDNITYFIMEEFGPRSPEKPLELPQIIKDTVWNSDASIFVAGTKPWELQTFRKPLTQFISQNGKVRHAHMPWITKQLIEVWMNADYEQIQKLCDRLINIVKDAKQITVTSPAGTNFTAHFSPKTKWFADNWIMKPIEFGNLPAWEIFTCIDHITDWIIIVDWVLWDYFDEKYWVIENTPLTIHIKDSRVIKAQCENKKLLEDFEKYINQFENSNRIWEFAIWTNMWIDKLTGNMLQDEKFPWVHIALWHWYPDITGVDWDCLTHMDCVLQNVTINVEWVEIMKNGKFCI